MLIEKRGQIAMFIIMGIVIMAAFGFMFYAASLVKKPQGPGTETPVSQAKQSSVEEYIKSVTIDSFNECFALIGPQGGKIYDSSFLLGGDQYGNSAYNPPSYINYPPHTIIGFGIRNGLVQGSEEIPIYRGRHTDTIVMEDIYPGGAKFIYGLNAPLPPMSSDGGPESMETQLSDCTRRRFVKYFDKTLFKDYLVQFLQEEPVVNVSINLEDIGIMVTYPVRIETKENIITTKDYYYTLNYPFGLLYRFVRDIIMKDINIRDVIMVHESNSDYTVTREEARNVDDPKTGLKYDVIIVTDNTFEFEGKPYNFTFIRENRAPDAGTVKFGDHVFYDEGPLLLICPNYYVKRPNLVDPDEDDFYAVETGTWGKDWYEFEGKCDPRLLIYDEETCGNEVFIFDIPTERCQVCCGGGRPLVVWVTDYGNMTDIAPFGARKLIMCHTGEIESGAFASCCEDECWSGDILCNYGEKCHGSNSKGEYVCGQNNEKRETCCDWSEFDIKCDPKCGSCSVWTNPRFIKENCWC